MGNKAEVEDYDDWDAISDGDDYYNDGPSSLPTKTASNNFKQEKTESNYFLKEDYSDSQFSNSNPSYKTNRHNQGQGSYQNQRKDKYSNNRGGGNKGGYNKGKK